MYGSDMTMDDPFMIMYGLTQSCMDRTCPPFPLWMWLTKYSYA